MIVRVSSACILVLLVAATGPARAQTTHVAVLQTPTKEEIHYLGKVNVNEASADELERVPGLSKADVQRIVEAREKSPITNLKLLKLPMRVMRFLRTEGASDFARIKKLPLEIIDTPQPSQSQDDQSLVSVNSIT